MFNIMKNGGHAQYGTYEFIADTEADIELAPKTVAPGSKMLCIENSTTYIFTPSLEWVEYAVEGGGGGKMEVIPLTEGSYDPETGKPTLLGAQEGVIYLVPNIKGSGSDLFIEWIYVNDSWEQFGSAAIDLENLVVGNSISLGRKEGTTIGQGSVAEGVNTTASEVCSHAEGSDTTASGSCSHAEGLSTFALGSEAHAEGYQTKATGEYGAHAEGSATTASGNSSHAEGFATKALASNAHSEGSTTTAESPNSHAEGQMSHAEGYESHAEGYSTTAQGHASHAEGQQTLAKGDHSHAEGNQTRATSGEAHAEGFNTEASGQDSHAEGSGSIASGSSSHAEGQETKASGSYSHSEGYHTEAVGLMQHVQGRFNITSNTALHIVGNGIGTDHESNAHVLEPDGTAWFAGDVYVGSTSGTNKDDGSKKLITADDVASLLIDATYVVDESIIEGYEFYYKNKDVTEDTSINTKVRIFTEENFSRDFEFKMEFLNDDISYGTKRTMFSIGVPQTAPSIAINNRNNSNWWGHQIQTALPTPASQDDNDTSSTPIDKKVKTITLTRTSGTLRLQYSAQNYNKTFTLEDTYKSNSSIVLGACHESTENDDLLTNKTSMHINYAYFKWL